MAAALSATRFNPGHRIAVPAAWWAAYFSRAGLLCSSSLAQSCSRVRRTSVIDAGRAAGSFSRQRSITAASSSVRVSGRAATIARALYRETPILILDDSLSAVDTVTEEAILAGLREFMADRTAIVIAHRLSTVKNADRIIVMADGRIIEEGTHDELVDQVRQADVVLDCSDNFETRFMINAACYACRIPLVSGAAIRFDGQLTTFDFRREASPCYHCLFGGEGFAETCAAEGILSPVVGIIGVMQALEAVKLITGAGDTLTGRLLLFDGLTSQFQQVRYRKDPGCSVCGS